jgi:hypothetical protein
MRSDLTAIRLDATNIDAFIDVVGTENCESAINVDLLNDKETDGTFLKSCRIVNNHEDITALMEPDRKRC